MPFKGTFLAQKLEPAECGLFSVADVTNHSGRSYDERWVRGLSFEFNSEPTIRLITNGGVEATNGELHDATGADDYKKNEPFFIEVESKISGMGLTDKSEFKVVLEQLEAVTQKAVEAELWSGFAAQEAANDNQYFADATSGPTVVTSGGVDADKALFLLEQAIANSPYGGKGVIHLTRDVASDLGSRLLYKTDSNGDGYVTTRLGTQVSIGSGYSGQGPGAGAGFTPSATNKWAYVTGPVWVHLGKSEVMNETLAQGFSTPQNDMFIKANRPASVFFDPTIFYAAQVTLP